LSRTGRRFSALRTYITFNTSEFYIGLTNWFARFAERLVPERVTPPGVIIEPEFLDEGALKAYSVALENVRHEIRRAGNITLAMMDQLAVVFETRGKDKLDDVARRDDEVDILDAEILTYLGKIRQAVLTEDESHTHQALMTSMTNIESLADVMETDMIGTAKLFMEGGFQSSSDETRDTLTKRIARTHLPVEVAQEAA
jgi:phosphate:Na+ symporter